jgi:hypothetical protein
MAEIIPSPGLVGRVYAIPKDTWLAIAQRVSQVLQIVQIGSIITQYIPNYPLLLSACQLWRNNTFPLLIADAAQTAMFANQAAATLIKLSGDLSGLSPDDLVPDPVKFIFRVEFAALAETAGELGSVIDKLAGEVANFVEQNRLADQAIAQLVGRLPPDWPGLVAIAGPIMSLDNGLIDMQGGWAIIAQALSAASSEHVEITIAALLAIDIKLAVTQWLELVEAVKSFEAMVATLAAPG